jgi:hypothetical protein
VLRNFISLHPNSTEFLSMINRELEVLENVPILEPLKLGRLSEKNEAAGKIRVFAIADSITQSVMKPLHDGIFSILRNLPMDGTFDQDAPLRRLVSLKDQLINEEFYSFDLSAATDRLPIDFQAQVLSIYYGETFASN